jgi:hypothetical protein
MENEEPVKKKRGRKKKSETEAVTGEPVEEKPKSRRGRKAKTVIATFDEKATTGNMSDDENVIVKLKIRSSDLYLSPDAYDAQSNLYAPAEGHTEQEMDINDIGSSNEKDDKLKVIELLKDFEMKSKAKEWPSTTSICCYWCCHKFDNPPVGIPIKYYDNTFHVFGCYCSLECAAAYNFSSPDSSDEIWERYNLLNLLARKLSYSNIVKTAPNRLALKMFGGHMEIDEFREFSSSNKVINVNFPPMMTLTQQIEEVNECDINSEYRYIPVDHERINKYKEKLILKRSKPITNYKHTLDHTMNLKIN